jgi:hypothetical protein
VFTLAPGSDPGSFLNPVFNLTAAFCFSPCPAFFEYYRGMNTQSPDTTRAPYDELPCCAAPLEWTAPEHPVLVSLLHGGRDHRIPA